MFRPKKVWVPFFWNSDFYWHNVRPEQIWCLSWKSSFFFGTHIFFLAQCLAWKSMNSFFYGTHTFFVTLLGPKKYESECPFFCNSYFFWHVFFFGHPYFFLAQFLARNNLISFFLELIYVFWTRTFFGAMFGPEKWDFLFVGTHTLFGRMFGLNMYEVPFFREL